MKIFFYSLLCLLIILFFGQNSDAAAGLKMLTVEPGARPVGMGGAFSSIPGDPYSAAFNPAARWGVKGLAGSFGYDSYWENTRMETGYISFEKRAVAISAGIHFAAVDNLEGRLGPTSDFITFDAHDVMFKLGAAFELEKNYIFGFSLGMMYEEIDTDDDAAFNFDLGLLMQPEEGLNIGLAVLNFGSTMQLRDEAFDLPTTYRAGISYLFRGLTGAVDIVNVDDDTHLHLGGEYNFANNFYIRAGYRTGYDTKNFSGGFGFARRNLRIDYAFLPYKEGLSDAHLFNLTFQI